MCEPWRAPSLGGKKEDEETVEVKMSYADVVRGTHRVSSDVADAVRQHKVKVVNDRQE